MVLPGSFPPCPNPAPARAFRTRAGGAPAGGGHRVRARTTLLTPRTPEDPRPPRAAQAGSAQPGVRRSPGPRPRAAEGSAVELGRRPLARLAWPRQTLQGISPQRPAPHARTPRVRGEREEGPGQVGARVWTQTYPALRAPLPPLEDAPLPPRPLPGRPGSGREERYEGAENGSASAPAPRRPGLGSPRCAGAARLLRRRVAARPPAARSPALPGARRRSLF